MTRSARWYGGVQSTPEEKRTADEFLAFHGFPEKQEPTNDTAVYDAMAYNHLTVQYDIWQGMGTLEAISRLGFKPDMSTLNYCPKEWLVDGFRAKDAAPPPR